VTPNAVSQYSPDSFDASTSTAEALKLMKDQDFVVVGVRQHSLVLGYLERENLGDGACGEHLHTFDDSTLISDSAPLADVVLGLARSPALLPIACSARFT
jgi:hypothetical protein